MLKDLVFMSNKYGRDPELVLAGGGNTSFKDGDILYVKGSGTQLATITEDGFVALDRDKIDETFTKEYSREDEIREAEVLSDMLASRLPGNEQKRPSVEAALHNIIDYRYVLHVHPAAVNAITCGVDGKEFADKMFGLSYIWIPICKPGYTLSVLCKKALDAFSTKHCFPCNLIFLQNHGIFFGANTLDDMDKLVNNVMKVINENIKRRYDFTEVDYEEESVCNIQKIIAEISGKDKEQIEYLINKDICNYIKTENYPKISKPFTPDHIVYCKARYLYTSEEALESDFVGFCDEYGYSPKVVVIKDAGVFVIGDTVKDLTNVRNLFLDGLKIAVYSDSFGGPLPMTDELIDFISNWEIESYRKKVAQ